MRKTIPVWLLLVAVAVAGWAQPEPPMGTPPAGDPPSRVARLNLLLGPVSFRPGSVEEWAPATLNYPLTIGDHLWTEAGSKAELHVGSTAVRMDGETALSVLNLDDRIVQLSITGGTIDVHIRYLGPEESFEVDTPNVAISLLRPGDYRISADGDRGTSYAVVRSGEAEVTGGGAAFPIRPGESANIVGTDQVSQEMGPAPPFDGFDQWCQTRNRREAASVSERYVPREMIGYEDLDEYGVWSEVPQYGMVWRPRIVVAGWSPYHFGHWVWVEPWGWTWVDDAPWGFAPFHYGRWAFAAGGWVWVPGRMVAGVRPVYAPALVAFVGGPRFSVAVGIGGGVGVAAWFPLGPGEVYRPAYRVSEVYVRNVNIVHVTDVTVINRVNVTNVRYVNRDIAGAVTVVPHTVFAGGRPVGGAAVMVRPGVMAQAEIVETARVAPTREAVLGHGGPMIVHAPPARFVDRRVVARNAPPPPPVSFAAREQALRANPGRPMDPGAMNTYRPAGQVPHPMVRTVVNPGMQGGGGQRFGQGEPGRRFGNQNPPQPQQQPAVQPRPQMNPPAPAVRPPVERMPEQQRSEPQRTAPQMEGRGGERPHNNDRPPARNQQRREEKKPEKQ